MDGTKIYDAYHPVGTCRMGDDEEAVLTPDMQVRGVDNLWVAGTSVLSSAGSANPTFTALCLAHRLAERLFRGISRDQSIILSATVGT
jgi:choline dehydrogenase